jgi:hypothetical protein
MQLGRLRGPNRLFGRSQVCHFSAVEKLSLHLGRLRGPITIARRVPDSNRVPQIRFSHHNQYDGFVMTKIRFLGFISKRNSFFRNLDRSRGMSRCSSKISSKLFFDPKIQLLYLQMNYRNRWVGDRAGELASGRASGRANGRAGGYRCRRHHAFDGGILRVGFFGMG